MNDGEIGEVTLVQRLKMRDREALADLLRMHQARLFRVAVGLVRDARAAEEVLQDVLITVWNRIGSFQGRSKFTTWLHRITVNAALMHLRKSRAMSRCVDLDSPGISDQLWNPNNNERPDRVALRRELADQVYRAIAALPEPYRIAVMLADVEEFSMEAIAQLTEMSIPGVKSRLHRARLMLRARLAPYLRDRTESPAVPIMMNGLCVPQ